MAVPTLCMATVATTGSMAAAGADTLNGGADIDTAGYSSSTVGVSREPARREPDISATLKATRSSTSRISPARGTTTSCWEIDVANRLEGLDGPDRLKGFGGPTPWTAAADTDTLDGGAAMSTTAGSPGRPRHPPGRSRRGHASSGAESLGDTGTTLDRHRPHRSDRRSSATTATGSTAAAASMPTRRRGNRTSPSSARATLSDAAARFGTRCRGHRATPHCDRRREMLASRRRGQAVIHLTGAHPLDASWFMPQASGGIKSSTAVAAATA